MKQKPLSRLTIAVVGLRYGQPANVQAECGHLANLKFVDAGRSEPRLPASDLIILMTRFIEHRWMNAALRTFPRRSVVLHPGGFSSLVRRILSLTKASS